MRSAIFLFSKTQFKQEAIWGYSRKKLKQGGLKSSFFFGNFARFAAWVNEGERKVKQQIFAIWDMRGTGT